MKKSSDSGKTAASEMITRYISDLGDWRGARIAELRSLIHDAAPELAETWKWGTPVWVHNGNVVAVAAFKNHVKLNFFDGASIADPQALFNAGLDAKTSRSIDFARDDKLDEAAIRQLVKAAVALDAQTRKSKGS
jgi:hypothetical protein